MSTLTIRLPESTAERLKTVARARGLSVNKLMEELSTQAIASFDAESRFRAMGAGGDIAKARRILDRLDS
jgi:predicted transcriptional regulator